MTAHIYQEQVSGERLQNHWFSETFVLRYFLVLFSSELSEKLSVA